MNGIIDVKVGKVTHRLRFTYPAHIEFERRCVKNVDGNAAKILIDLVYSSLYAEAMRTEQPIPEYSVAFDLVDEMSLLDDWTSISDKIWEVYNISKYGADFQKRIKDYNDQQAKKKAEE